MKFRVERDVLTEAVTWTARTLPARPPAPVLSGVRIEATQEGVVKLASFDYEVSARGEIPAEVTEPGTILVSGRLLAEIAKALPHKPVDFTVDGTKVSVVCGASRFSLLTMPVEEYPTLPTMPELTGVVDGSELSAAVSQVTVAASRDDTLPLLTGVRIEIEGEKVTLLATDRYRLALREMTWRPSAPDMSTVALVRARTLNDVSKSLGPVGDVNVALSVGEGVDLIGFEAGGRQTTSLLVDGDYPHVRRLFPDETPIHAVVATQPLIDAARRVALVAERNTPIRLNFSEGQVVLDAGQGDDAQASEVLESTLVGEDISVAFNPQFLLDGLNALGTDFVRLSFTHPNKPVEFTGQESLDGEDSKHYRYLLVPIRFAN
ncbi:DNA polymerase III subunit beta [Jonesia denitrificans]|uniref:Beta sliding clamp n=1 Tax=Jonesia denitrificans (strain ATCC 14870 / DSM 20603 / BCRC 15368 / CIP 55.134 / JCM 11481 / NBRC 15587 / NCTC 10816 / Prevot 55134) TaxID=471856 RepID=C7R4Q8_JONDD|nr:DNA polymerase III subunit beta [Jonesia denitrificans]ACV07681.1 DNA polymerase III, beta subunit [Jonesia denitrificans DSM 20603]ASE08590.1 DNA polymerase III subunit beta [Jonesia denitrificans]QXB43199.1 DNA polymerase III subunit beta [Jonesia denitrificans]SQH19650.1 DNA polymerase III subunit beta [Jonesia denitrificans]